MRVARASRPEARARLAVVVPPADREDVPVEVERVAVGVGRARSCGRVAPSLDVRGHAEDVAAGVRLQARRGLAVPADRVDVVRLDGAGLPALDHDAVLHVHELDLDRHRLVVVDAVGEPDLRAGEERLDGADAGLEPRRARVTRARGRRELRGALGRRRRKDGDRVARIGADGVGLPGRDRPAGGADSGTFTRKERVSSDATRTFDVVALRLVAAVEGHAPDAAEAVAVHAQRAARLDARLAGAERYALDPGDHGDGGVAGAAGARVGSQGSAGRRGQGQRKRCNRSLPERHPRICLSFLRPTGLADGLAPNEQRYRAETLRHALIRPFEDLAAPDWIPRSPVPWRLCTGDSAGLRTGAAV